MSPDPVEDLPMTTARRGTPKTCAHCGMTQRGYGNINGANVCHPDNGPWPDCYRLVTVYGETLGSRLPQVDITPNAASDSRGYNPAASSAPAQALTRLEELAADAQQRADAATPGPWEVDPAVISEEHNDYVDVDGPNGGWVARTDPNTVTPTADADFIAAARSDVPALVSGLRQTTTALHAVLDLHQEHAGDCAVCYPGELGYPCPTVRAVVSALDGGEHR